jgi:hypothetical protein
MTSRRLDVHQVAVRFLPLGSESAAALPQRHAALSMPLEGSGKTTGPDQRRSYAMARGSALECVAIVASLPRWFPAGFSRRLSVDRT